MQVGERIAVRIAVLISPASSDAPCWACEEPKSTSTPNDLAEDPSSVGTAENQLMNDSSRLGKNLGHRPKWTIRVPGDPNQTTEIVPAAHHLIPGNASLKQVPSLLTLVEKSKGKIREDIGYDVNCAQNGVWLAANYGVNPESAFKKKWTEYEHQDHYATEAMKTSRTQFHDSHPSYSSNVTKTLRALADKIKLNAPEKCGICSKTLSDKARPPYGLVGRLHAISRMHRKFLVGPARKWPIDSGYFTSKRSALLRNPIR